MYILNKSIGRKQSPKVRKFGMGRGGLGNFSFSVTHLAYSDTRF